MDITKEQFMGGLQDRYNTLPDDVKAVIISDTYQKIIGELGTKYNLSPDELVNLEMDTTFVLLGVIHPERYPDEIVADIPKLGDNIHEFVNLVNQQIFAPIRASLAEMQSEGTNALDEAIAHLEKGTVENIFKTEAREELHRDATVLETAGIHVEEEAAVSEEGNLVKKDVERGIENPPKMEPRMLNPIEAPISHTLPTSKISMPPPPTRPVVPTQTPTPVATVTQPVPAQPTPTPTPANPQPISSIAPTPAPTAPKMTIPTLNIAAALSGKAPAPTPAPVPTTPTQPTPVAPAPVTPTPEVPKTPPVVPQPIQQPASQTQSTFAMPVRTPPAQPAPVQAPAPTVTPTTPKNADIYREPI